MRTALRVTLALLACAVVGLAGCAGGGRPAMSGALTVFTSPALADAVAGAAHAFTTTYPGVRVDTLVEPDSRLAARAAAGPTPDVIVAESPATLEAAGATTVPVHLARGQLVLAVPTGNPALVRGLADVARPGLRVALCAAEEPCGAVAAEVLAAAGLAVPDGAILEPDVRAALAHVTEGTVDVALVYRSDAASAGDAVMTIEMVESSVALADFVAVVPAAAPNPAVAQAFLDHLASPAILDTLTRDGFRPPE